MSENEETGAGSGEVTMVDSGSEGGEPDVTPVGAESDTVQPEAPPAEEESAAPAEVATVAETTPDTGTEWGAEATPVAELTPAAEEAPGEAAAVPDDAAILRSDTPAADSSLAASYEAGWVVPPPAGDVWTARPWVNPEEREAEGKAARKRVPRASQATFEPARERDPIAILEAQEADRLPELLPLRHARMAESAFAYYRGTPAVMAFDLSTTPRTDILVQASGDAHLSNFGLFGSPERSLVFDANDFDETLPAPWEWDVKRLAASIVVAGRGNGFGPNQNRVAAMATVRAYREWIARYAGMGLLEVWYAKLTDTDILAAGEATGLLGGREGTARRRVVETFFSKARQRDQMRAFGALTTVVDGRRVILDDPPVVQHVDIPDTTATLEAVFNTYRATLAENRRDFLERYRFVDLALKVVGVGSVGTRCFVMVLEGRDEEDPLILQAKQAEASVMKPYVERSRKLNHGERVVVGQRAMQATPDIFLGWSRGPLGRDYYFRQLWDMKGSVEITTLRPEGLGFYGGICARSLARAHARTGDAVAIAAYLGTRDTFDGAVADFSEAYAEQNERDYRAFVAAIRAGRVSSGEGGRVSVEGSSS